VTKLLEKAREVDADIVGVSALLTTTMVRQRDVVEGWTTWACARESR